MMSHFKLRSILGSQKLKFLNILFTDMQSSPFSPARTVTNLKDPRSLIKSRLHSFLTWQAFPKSRLLISRMLSHRSRLPLYLVQPFRSMQICVDMSSRTKLNPSLVRPCGQISLLSTRTFRTMSDLGSYRKLQSGTGQSSWMSGETGTQVSYSGRVRYLSRLDLKFSFKVKLFVCLSPDSRSHRMHIDFRNASEAASLVLAISLSLTISCMLISDIENSSFMSLSMSACERSSRALKMQDTAMAFRQKSMKGFLTFGGLLKNDRNIGQLLQSVTRPKQQNKCASFHLCSPKTRGPIFVHKRQNSLSSFSGEEHYQKFNHQRRERRNRKYIQNLRSFKSQNLSYFNPFQFGNRDNLPKLKDMDQMDREANLQRVYLNIVQNLYSKNALPKARRR